MRISTGYQFETYSSDIRVAQEKLFTFEKQVSTGKRINRPSDDPYGTSSSLTMRSLKSGIEQYQSNLETAKGNLGYTEGALDEMHKVMSRAYQLSVSGANSSTEQTARNAMAAEITSLQRRLVDLANSRGPNGAYLFAGQKNDAQPYSAAGATLTYSGDTNDVVVETGPSDTMAVNSQGEPLVSDAFNRLETLKNNLLGGNVGALTGVSITEMQTSMQAINAERGAVGAKMRTVSDLTSQYTRRVDDLTKGISDVEDVDISQAILNYRLAQAAYEGALNVASQGFQTSLMDFIRG
jgi:flagellar hook-associated protein 3 FlgL